MAHVQRSMLRDRAGAAPWWPPTGRDLWLAAALFLSSAGTLDQYLGLGGVLAYAAGAIVFVPLARRIALPLLMERVDERRARLLAVASFILIVVVFAIVYPIVNTHSAVAGSDRDDAATLGARHLLHLEYPYSQPTYLGNLISQLPGALLLAAPFAAIGSSAYQNLFWIAALFLALRRRLGDSRLALAACWFLLFAAPGTLRELLTGGDVIANNAYLIVFALGVLAVPPDRRLVRAASAVGLGLALSSRANSWLLVPLLFAALVRREGVRTASALVGIAVAVCAAVTLPFYVYAPDRFSPLLTADKIGRLESSVPGARAILLGVCAALALVLAYRSAGAVARVFRDFAVVQAALFSAAVVLSSIVARTTDFDFLLLAYGLFALFPAVVGVWDAARRGRTPVP